jgi:hypothetical protein
VYKTDHVYVPKDLDWVTQRADCTAYRIFKQLQVEVEKDVTLRQSRVSPHEKTWQLAFRLDVPDEITFSVVRGGIAGLLSIVQFRLDNERIIVRDGRNQIAMSATLTLNEIGECVLRVNEPADDPAKDSELRTWQFRLRALERLFFDLRPITV